MLIEAENNLSQEDNLHYLMTALNCVHQALNNYINHQENQPAKEIIPPTYNPKSNNPKSKMGEDYPRSILEHLCGTFGLSDFERDLLLLCTGMELDHNWSVLCAKAQGNENRGYPTFGLAFAALGGSHWSAMTPTAPLRKWRLIEVGTDNTLMNAPLRIDEQILHYLVGVYHLNEQLMAVVKPLETNNISILVNSHQRIVEQIVRTWKQTSDKLLNLSPHGKRLEIGDKETGGLEFSLSDHKNQNHLPIIQLCGNEVVSKRAIAQAVCTQLQLKLYTLSARNLPNNPSELYQLLTMWEREALLSKSALLLDCDDININDPNQENIIKSSIESIESPLIISSSDYRISPKQRSILTFDIYKPTSQEQRTIWQSILGDSILSETILGDKLTQVNAVVDNLVSHFNLTAPEINSAYIKALATNQDLPTENLNTVIATQESNPEHLTFPNEGTSSMGEKLATRERFAGDEELATDEGEGLVTGEELAADEVNSFSYPSFSLLWDSCRTQAQPKLDELAQRMHLKATWDDLVLSETQIQTLQSMAAHIQQRIQVYQKWGFAGKGGRGLGISVLFSGVSGTGKTMSAEVLANELNLDLYRIDLSSTVSKYIGETEKNLRRIFDAAEGGGAILLFDEADALFGKRSDVKDARDRYANMEVSYLLQRMEEYQGLAILTTNLKDSIDNAFLRRIRFVVKYSFPDAKQRQEIWRRIFPQDTPTENLNFAKLAKLNVAGGNIRNIALNAAFIAADSGEPVMMKHLYIATQSEYMKLERTLTDSEIKGWV